MGMCIRGRNRRLLVMESAASASASSQPAHVPELQTPRSLKDKPRFRNVNQSATTNSHSASNPPLMFSKKRCSTEPCRAAGMKSVMSLEIAQITAGSPKPRIADSSQHIDRVEEG